MCSFSNVQADMDDCSDLEFLGCRRKYVYDMEQSDTWGDHICLQAIADAYGLKINIITSYPQQDSCFIGITPDKVKTHRILYLSFWAEIHYNSIYPKRYYPPLNADPHQHHLPSPSQCSVVYRAH